MRQPLTPERLAEIRHVLMNNNGKDGDLIDALSLVLLDEVERLKKENERLESHRKTDIAFVHEARAERNKLRDWQRRVVKYHGYLDGIIAEAKEAL